MIRGISGSLLSHDALERELPDALRGLLDEAGRDAARRRLSAWHHRVRSELGPATSARGILDRLFVPLAAHLGYESRFIAAGGSPIRAVLHSRGVPIAVALVTDWGQAPTSTWRDAVRQGVAEDVRWCFCAFGASIRLLDTRRTYSRRYVEFDLAAAMDDERTFAVFWGLLRADAMAGGRPGASPLLDRAVSISEQHRSAVRSSLQHGVHDALVQLLQAFGDARRRAARRHPGDPTKDAFEESLVVIYRILFLLFAEARGLVPRWHPIFRDSYTIESLRGPVEMLPRPRGLWETLQAIARLAHRGCTAGSLRVPPFNGRLFSPAHAPLADSVPLDNAPVRRALLALTTRTSRTGRQRVGYADLGVEQLGGVYERLLDFEPAPTHASGPAALVPAERRKSSGSFYTPRSITEYLIRRTLAPLVADATPDQILSLRVIDPAMGSGAFLVAACRYLGHAYEAALLKEGALTREDIGESERAQFRRSVAQRCLYGVDLNPMAVQLARLSLWLATLASDRPLTFFDHRLRTGNSIVGASPNDVLRQRPGARTKKPEAALPLFPAEELDAAVESAVRARARIALEPDDTIEQVRSKERTLATLNAAGSTLVRWKQVADLWCAEWFRHNGAHERRPPFGALADQVLGGCSTLPRHLSEPLLADASSIAARERFFHWPLEFPEVFHDAAGRPASGSGFDAVVGNPPWEMLRGDRGNAANRQNARAAAVRIAEFTRTSGVYRLQGNGHANLYQIFLERMMSLLRPGGRLGIVLPFGFAIDAGSAALRHAVLDRSSVDTFVSIDNRDGVFPIHRSLRFLLVAATSGARTTALPCRFGVRQPDSLDGIPDTGRDPAAVPVSRALLDRVGGTSLTIPDLRTPLDLEILTALAFSAPALGHEDGWNVRFGRELNATDDRRHFNTSAEGLPVLEGKHLRPFRVDIGASRFHIRARTAAGLLPAARTYARMRLAYRDVASSSNRTTLIAALVPPRVVTTHTLFCLKDDLDLEAQHFLCGVFNSFVANYLVRLRVGTHVSAAIIEQLPVPKPSRDSTEFVRIAALSRRLTEGSADVMSRAALQAEVALVYGLTTAQFRSVLDSFPLVPVPERDSALRAFCDIVS